MAVEMAYICSCGAVFTVDPDQWPQVESHLTANPSHTFTEGYYNPAGSGVPATTPLLAPGGNTFLVSVSDFGALTAGGGGGAEASRFPKSNLTATTPPTSTDDSTLGYEPGSWWIDTTTTKTAYACFDATATAALWQIFARLGVDPTSTANTGLPVWFNFFTAEDDD